MVMITNTTCAIRREKSLSVCLRPCPPQKAMPASCPPQGWHSLSTSCKAFSSHLPGLPCSVRLTLSTKRKKQPSKQWSAGLRVRRGSLQKCISKCLIWEERWSTGCTEKGDFSEALEETALHHWASFFPLFVSSLHPDQLIFSEASGPNMGLI